MFLARSHCDASVMLSGIEGRDSGKIWGSAATIARFEMLSGIKGASILDSNHDPRVLIVVAHLHDQDIPRVETNPHTKPEPGGATIDTNVQA